MNYNNYNCEIYGIKVINILFSLKYDLLFHFFINFNNIIIIYYAMFYITCYSIIISPVHVLYR